MNAKAREREYEKNVAQLSHLSEDGRGTLLEAALSQLRPGDLRRIAHDMQRHSLQDFGANTPPLKVVDHQSPRANGLRIEQDIAYGANKVVFEQKETANKYLLKAYDWNGEETPGERKGPHFKSPKKYAEYINKLGELADHGDGISLAKELNRLNLEQLLKVSRDLEARNAREKSCGIWAPPLKVSVYESEDGTRVKLSHDIKARRDHTLVDIQRGTHETTVKGRRF